MDRKTDSWVSQLVLFETDYQTGCDAHVWRGENLPIREETAPPGAIRDFLVLPTRLRSPSVSCDPTVQPNKKQEASFPAPPANCCSILPLSQAQHPDLDKRLRRGRRWRRRSKQGCSLKNPAAFRKYLKGGSFWRVCEERRVTKKSRGGEDGKGNDICPKKFGLTIWQCGVRRAAPGFGIWRKNVLTFFAAETARHCCQTTNTTSNY